MKKTALITDASSGIGRELAALFAKDGYNLVLVARSEDRLRQLAQEFESQHRVTAKVLPKDLSIPTAPQEVFDALEAESIQVDVLVNNAGFQVYGPFAENDWQKEQAMIQVNLVALTHLTKLFLPGMVKRGAGKIMNIGSTGSFSPGPLNAIYCATKAYVLSFSEAIAEELDGTGVTVTALCPGATETEFAVRGEIEDVNLFQNMMSAADVAKAGYRAMKNNRRVIVPGWINKMMAMSSRMMPHRIVTRVAKNMMSRA